MNTRLSSGYLAAVIWLVGCGDGSAVAPSNAATEIAVSVATTGIDLDIDGYALTVDGGSPITIGVNGTASVAVAAGTHAIKLGGVASNCSSDSPIQPIDAPAGRRTAITVRVACRIRQVAFTSDRSGVYQIFLMNRDGTNITRITDGSSDFVTDWSPDGSQILFGSTDAAGVRQVSIVNADGSNRRQLTTLGANHVGSFSPDGKTIAFTSGRDALPGGGELIYLMNADGTNQRALLPSSGASDNPRWSPDGTRLAYTRILSGSPTVDAFIVNADGSGAHQISSGVFDKRSPGWAVDGKSVLMSRRPGPLNDTSEPYQIWSAPLDGTAPRRLTTNTGMALVPRWSPDATFMTYSILRGSTYELRIVTADGTDARMLLTSTSSDYSVVWRP